MGKRNTSVFKTLRLIEPQSFTGTGKWKQKFLLVWKVIFRHKNLAHVSNCALRSLMHEMLIYIYLNSVTVISLFLMIRMQQKTANHKYSSRKTHWFGSNRKLFFYLHGNGFVQRICSTKHFCSAPSSCKLSLSSSSTKRFVWMQYPPCRVRYSQYYSHVPQLVTSKTKLFRQYKQ